MWLAFLGAVAFAAAFLLLPRRVALALPLIVLVYWLVASKPIWFGPYPYGVKQAGAGALFQGIRGVAARLDRPRRAGRRGRRPSSGRAVSDRFTVNQNEFFNRSVGQVYYTVRPTRRRDRRAARSRVDQRTGTVRLADGQRAPPRLPADRRLRSSRTPSPSPTTRRSG